MALSDTLLAAWQFDACSSGQIMVLPDGCRDLIWHQPANGPAYWFVTALSNGPEPVRHLAGESYRGFRLQPGVQIAETTLLKAVTNAAPDTILERLHDCTWHLPALTEALACLQTASSIRQAAATLGVTERTLERLVQQGTQRSPNYWRQLARARRAARALTRPQPLVEIALQQGYADQAQMSRDFQRWFGQSPGNGRRQPDWLAALQASGFG